MKRKRTRTCKNPFKGYIGNCPRCGLPNAEMDVIDWEKPRAKQHVECRRCKCTFLRNKAVRPEAKRMRRYAFRLPGFRRTIWKTNDLENIRSHFIDILNMPLGKDGVERKLYQAFKIYMTETGCKEKQLDALLLQACQRCLWSKSDFIKERFDAIYMDKPFQMVLGYQGKKVM